jgi:hypothetical protein
MMRSRHATPAPIGGPGESGLREALGREGSIRPESRPRATPPLSLSELYRIDRSNEQLFETNDPEEPEDEQQTMGISIALMY